MAMAIIQCGTSLIPIGLIPGHLLRGIKRLAMKADSPSGWTLVVAKCPPTPASAVHRLLEADWKEEQRILYRHVHQGHAEGPAASFVLRVAFQMVFQSGFYPYYKYGGL
jgi:hypothetical protein